MFYLFIIFSMNVKKKRIVDENKIENGKKSTFL